MQNNKKVFLAYYQEKGFIPAKACKPAFIMRTSPSRDMVFVTGDAAYFFTSDINTGIYSHEERVKLPAKFCLMDGILFHNGKHIKQESPTRITIDNGRLELMK